MRPSTRERIARIIAGSLIASDISLRDIESFSESLGDESFRIQLKILLNAFSDTARENHFKKHIPDIRRDDAETAYKIIQSRRLSKQAVLKQLAAASPSLNRKLIMELPLRQMLNEFFLNASRQEARLVMDRLTKIGAHDPYLEGIVSRQKSVL